MLEKLFKNRKKPQQQNNSVQSARKRIIIQAAIAVQTIIIVVALIFGMSAAWYTNVLQTSGLQFEAEAWGFTGEILFDDEPILARPGESGVVGLTVTNDSDDMINVAVRVSTAQMVDEMQKRMFFYVDTAVTKNGEVLDRTYINSQDSYTYTILSQSQLTLTEQYANDVLLKWQWVYDMEGYYFLGNVTRDGDNIVARADEYLRPVEYDLDNATFKDGLLATVGEQTVEEFLEELSGKDGYEQDIMPTDMTGYYQVDVDEDGYGVWVYLCNWAEIQQATTYDSQLGQLAAAAPNDETIDPDDYQFIARLMVVGQVTHSEYTPVYAAEQLTELLNTNTLVQLQNDIELTETLIINSGAEAVLDLNDHTILAPTGGSALALTDASKLIMINGELQGSTGTDKLVTVEGSMLTLSNVALTGPMRYGVYVADDGGTTDSRVRLFDCSIDATVGAVSVRGNGEESEGSTQLIVENCELNSDYITVLGNGTSTYWGTDIQIIDSTLTGYYAALYQPQGDSLTRVSNNSILRGGTGVVIKGGDLRITDSIIQGIFSNPDDIQDPAVNNSGFSDTGDALYVDCSYDVPMNIVIEGSSSLRATAADSKSIRVFRPDENTSVVTVSVTGGYYDDSVTEYVAPGYQYNENKEYVEPAPEQEEESDAE